MTLATDLSDPTWTVNIPYNSETMMSVDGEKWLEDHWMNNNPTEVRTPIIAKRFADMSLWELYLPVNKKGSVDANGGNSMGDMNRDYAVEAYLVGRCMGVVDGTPDAPCTNGKEKCTQFFSTGAMGKHCQYVANTQDIFSYTGTQAAYSALCGLDTVTHLPVDTSKRGPWVKDALKLPDCACANYKQSQYAQPTMNSFNYSSFIDWLHKTNPSYVVPAQGYCWWPSCTDLSNSLRIDALFPANQSQEDPRCPALVNCIKIGGTAKEPVARSCVSGLPSNSSTPATHTNRPGSAKTPASYQPSQSYTPSASPVAPSTLYEKVKTTLQTWSHKKWFIPVVVCVGVLLLAGILYAVLASGSKNKGVTATVSTARSRK